MDLKRPPIIASCLLLMSAVCFAQSAKDAKTQNASPAGAPKQLDPNFIRWRVYLDTLAQEARSVPDERRPYVVTDVASAYWEFDKDEATRLFTAALDEASRLAEQDKKYRDLVDYVLNAAARADAGMVDRFRKRLAGKEGETKYKGDLFGSGLLEMVKDDPPRAAQLMEAIAPDGMSMSAPFSIFELAKVDKRLADRVFAAYLAKASSMQDVSLEKILGLAGYAFGYTEHWTMEKTGGAYGASRLPVPGLTARKDFASSFLSVAYSRADREIRVRDANAPPELGSPTWTILFAAIYLKQRSRDLRPRR